MNITPVTWGALSFAFAIGFFVTAALLVVVSL